ncbi:galactoside 2-alpha-L-fucosyltransferase 1 [Biomphalaria pfeifferi]|uniref:L-Fucosyltransferase n=1 Tax=Biomphalaria pfeifferi TaxID=112525 RepID=A0AAD8FME0_BIOPF|nr:galactoside 2-alpha-L-fucosyltransferase 1 [Biomphalaria pfeifferi]
MRLFRRNLHVLGCAGLVFVLLVLSNLRPKQSSMRHPLDRNRTSRDTALSRTYFNGLNFSNHQETAKPLLWAVLSTPTVSRYSIVYTEYGQLGNAMFQYASIMGVAFMNNRLPLALKSTQLLKVFKISHVMRKNFIFQSCHRVYESAYAKYHPEFEHLPERDICLNGFFQSYKYFHKYAKQIKREFEFLDDIEDQARDMLNILKISLVDRKLIGVHVRRGDKLNKKHRDQGECVAPETYFQKAFRWMREHHGNVTFLVATDDVKWCKYVFSKENDVIVLPPAYGPVHMCLLSMCHHVIMSVGTFGWWIGWLSGGDVIYYKHQVREGSVNSKGFNISDFALPSWIGLGD